MAQKAKLGLALWGARPMGDLVRQVRKAEALGFESVWAIDSQLICRDVFVTMAACLAATSKIVLATGVTQPKTRHVSATASALATLHEMYPGRVRAGVGTGFSSLRTLGLPAAKGRELEGFVGALKRLLRQETVAFENGVSGTLTWPDGPSDVEVVVAASGPRNTKLGASVADGLILFQGVAPRLIDRGLAWMAEGAAAAGRDPTDLSVTCWAPLGVGPTRAAAYNDVRARVASAVIQANPAWFDEPDRQALLDLKARYDDYAHAGAQPDHAALITDRMVDDYAIAGDPADIRRQLAALTAHPNIDRVVLTSQGGDASFDDVLRVFEREILPGMA